MDEAPHDGSVIVAEFKFKDAVGIWHVAWREEAKAFWTLNPKTGAWTGKPTLNLLRWRLPAKDDFA